MSKFLNAFVTLTIIIFLRVLDVLTTDQHENDFVVKLTFSMAIHAKKPKRQQLLRQLQNAHQVLLARV